jgi:uncharacterized protein (DUF849 family)
LGVAPKLVRLVREFGLELATPDEARQMLGLARARPPQS